MPQELHVVCCYKCHMFQVHIVKKATRWTCKMCGEKQSLIKVYGKGSGRECRELAQNLNKQQILLSETLGSVDVDSDAESNDNTVEAYSDSSVNKWSEFLDTKNIVSDNKHDFDNSNNSCVGARSSNEWRSKSYNDANNITVGVGSSKGENKWTEFLWNVEDKGKKKNNSGDVSKYSTSIDKSDVDFYSDDDDYNTIPYKKQKLCENLTKDNSAYKCNFLKHVPCKDNKWNVFLGQTSCEVTDQENKNIFNAVNYKIDKDLTKQKAGNINIFADKEQEDLDSILDI